MRNLSNMELQAVGGGAVPALTADEVRAMAGTPGVSTKELLDHTSNVTFVNFSDTTRAQNPSSGEFMCPVGYEPADMKFTVSNSTQNASLNWGKDGFSATLGGKSGENSVTYSCSKTNYN